MIEQTKHRCGQVRILGKRVRATDKDSSKDRGEQRRARVACDLFPLGNFAKTMGMRGWQFGLTSRLIRSVLSAGPPAFCGVIRTSERVRPCDAPHAAFRIVCIARMHRDTDVRTPQEPQMWPATPCIRKDYRAITSYQCNDLEINIRSAT